MFQIGIDVHTGINVPGFFDGRDGIVPGVADNAVAVFQVLAWKDAITFDLASQRVASAIFSQRTGNSHPPDLPTPATLEFPVNLVISGVPEPAITTLWLVACVALLAIRCRR